METPPTVEGLPSSPPKSRNLSALRIYAGILIISLVTYTTLDIYLPLIESRCGTLKGLPLIKWVSLAIVPLILWRIFTGPLAKNAGALAMPVNPIGGNLRFSSAIGDPLLILRFLAFFSVWMTHSALLLKPPNDIWDAKHFLLRGCAHQGMAVFFTLSGYLMGKAFARGRYLCDQGGLTAFYGNRALRILPLYLGSQLVVMLLVRPELLMFSNWRGLLRLATFTYYSAPGQPGPITSLWSLSTEIQYYVLAPFFYILLVPFMRRTWTTILGITICVALGSALRLSLFFNGADWNLYRFKSLIVNLDLFLIGLFFNGIVETVVRRPVTWKSNTIWLCAGAILMALIYIGCCAFTGLPWLPLTGKTAGYPAAPGSFFYDLAPSAVALVTACTIFALEVGAWRFTQRSTSAKDHKTRSFFLFLQYLGICSYGMYVWHVPILEAANRVCPATATYSDYIIRNMICLIGVLLLSWATYELVEKPFVAKKTLPSY